MFSRFQHPANFWLLGLALSLTLQSPLAMARPLEVPCPPQVVAQTFEAEKSFFLEVLQLTGRGQEAEARALILSKRELARQSFRLILKNHASLTGEDEKQVATLFLNLVAQVFEVEGELQLSKTLKSKKLWKPPTTGKKPTRPVQIDDGHDFAALGGLALRFGNFVAAERMSRVASKIFEIARPGDPKVRTASLMARFQAAAIEAYSGRPGDAIADLTDLIDPLLALRETDIDFTLYSTLVSAGWRGARPDVVEKYLPLLRDLGRQVKNHKGHLYRFVAESWAYRQEPTPGTSAQFLARAQSVWKELDGYTTEGDTQTEGRVFGEALAFWIKGLARFLHDPNLDASARKALEAQVNACLSKARLLVQESWKEQTPQSFNPEFIFAMLQAHLDLLESQRQRGDIGESRRALEDLGIVLGQSERQLKEFETAFLKEMGREMDSRKGKIEELHKAGLTVEAEALKFSLLEGDLSRLRANYHRAWQKQLQAEARTDDGPEIEMHLGESEKYQKLQSRGQGYQGLEDARWDRLAYLLRARPPQWVRNGAVQVAELLKVNEQLQFIPGNIRALTFDGEIKSADGLRSEAQTSLKAAADLIESQVAEAATPAMAGEILAEYDRAYSLLAQLQFEQGKIEDALSTLDRMQQVHFMVGAATDTEAGSPDVMATLAALRGENSSLQQELMIRRASNLDPKASEERLSEIAGKYRAALDQLHRQYPRFYNLLTAPPLNFAKEQKLIPKNAAVIQHFAGDEALYIVVISNTDVKVRQVSITRKELVAEINRFQRLLQTNPGRGLSESEPLVHWIDDGTPIYQQAVAPFKASSGKLHRWLIEPVESDISDKDLLIFVPTGPLESLPMPTLGREQPTRGLEFLIERKQCARLLNLSDLSRVSQPTTPATGGVLAMDRGEPGSEQELEAVTGPLAGSQKLQGPEAKLTSIPAGMSYLHLALPLSRAGLAPSDLYGLSLGGLRLVTLSAMTNDVELTKLSRAFQAAGINSMLANTWRSPRPSSQELLGNFYRQLKEGQSLSRALQAAEQAMLANPKTAHPYYWANFTLLGDWR